MLGLDASPGNAFAHPCRAMFATVPTASGFVAMLATGFQERRGAGKLASTASSWLSNASGMEGFAGFNLCSLVVAVIGPPRCLWCTTQFTVEHERPAASRSPVYSHLENRS